MAQYCSNICCAVETNFVVWKEGDRRESDTGAKGEKVDAAYFSKHFYILCVLMNTNRCVYNFTLRFTCGHHAVQRNNNKNNNNDNRTHQQIKVQKSPSRKNRASASG